VFPPESANAIREPKYRSRPHRPGLRLRHRRKPVLYLPFSFCGSLRCEPRTLACQKMAMQSAAKRKGRQNHHPKSPGTGILRACVGLGIGRDAFSRPFIASRNCGTVAGHWRRRAGVARDEKIFFSLF